jgi:hypothetical protein
LIAPGKPWADLSAVLFLIALVIGLQVYSGAYGSDFTADDDEAAHAVSSLMVHDYVVHGFPENSLHYAERFYTHYPKVAIGHWPPLFYAGEAAWMLVFGRTRIAMLAFEAALSVALLASVFVWVRRDYGVGIGLICAVVLAMAPFMQSDIISVAPNIALALLAFWAVVALGNYFDRGRRRDAVLFAVLAAAAAGVHGRGVALAFLPLVLPLTGKFPWTRIRISILTGAIAVAVVVPWLLRQASPPSIRNVFYYAGIYWYRCGVSMGWPVLILAVAGAVAVLRRTTQPRRWLTMPALAISGWLFHSVVNAYWSDRYLVTAAPAVAVLAGAGLHWCFTTPAMGRMARAAVLAVVCGGLAWSALPLARKDDLGYHRLGPLMGHIDLIAGDPLHEGAFVSEMALRDHGLDRIALRGTKVLATSTWSGYRYQLLFTTPADVLGFLDRARVETVLVQRDSRQPHVVQLAEALGWDGTRWREVHLEGQPAGVAAFGRVAALPPGEPVIFLDLRYTLRQMLEVKP